METKKKKRFYFVLSNATKYICGRRSARTKKLQIVYCISVLSCSSPLTLFVQIKRERVKERESERERKRGKKKVIKKLKNSLVLQKRYNIFNPTKKLGKSLNVK